MFVICAINLEYEMILYFSKLCFQLETIILAWKMTAKFNIHDWKLIGTMVSGLFVAG